ncbi:MAG TPA: hypothetical protein VFA09_00525 [Ktedonobacteraceae bacterium]|nr:hypothetical protein [Ktedonobacteraceae bacterium]
MRAAGAVSTEQAVTSTTTLSRSSRLKLLYSPVWLLWFCFLLAILTRVWLIVHTNGTMAGDEMMVGLQAEHILQGERPVYYYAQPYMGSLEAYLAAFIFLFTGPAVWAMRLETIPMSLLMVYLAWRFAGSLAETAHLSNRLKTTFMTIAALVAAFPPLYDMAEEMRVQGGYMEAFIIMLWLLFCAFRLTQRLSQRAPLREIALRWAGIGFLVGLGLWIDPLIVYACAAIAIWIGGYFILTLLRPGREVAGQSWRDLIEAGILIVYALPAALVGFLPGIIWGLQNHWANVFYLLHGGTAIAGNRLVMIKEVAQLYITCIVPHTLGGSLPTQQDVTVANPHLVTFGLFVVCAAIVLSLAGLLFGGLHPVFMRVRQLTLLPMLFIFCASIIFCVTPNTAAALGIGPNSVPAPCGPYDGAGRYAVPLVDALPFLIATLIIFPGLILLERQQRQSSQVPEQGQEPALSLQHTNALPVRRFASSRKLLAFLSTGLLVVLAAYFVFQGIAYAQADPNYTFQATGCRSRNPTNVDPIVNYLKSEHIHYVWATGWVGDHITFETDGSIIATQPNGRIVSNDEALLHADRASMLLLDWHIDPHPAFLQVLDANHVTYRVARFYSAPGVDAVIVTPLNRTLSPSDRTFAKLFGRVFDPCLPGQTI